jgi:hypothetical protein
MACLAAPTALASGPTLVVSKSNLVAGDVVLVPMALRAAPDLGVVEFELHYDANVLRLTSIAKGAMLGEQSTIEAELTAPGRAIVRIHTAQHPLTGDGELCKARIVLPDDAPQAAHPLTLTNVQARRVARSQGDARHDVAHVNLAVASGQLRVIDSPLPIWVLGAVAGAFILVVAHSLWTTPPRFLGAMRRARTQEQASPPSLDRDLVVEHPGTD